MAQDSTVTAHTVRLTDMVNSLNQDFAKKTSEGAAIKAKDLEVMHLKSAQAELHDRLEKLEAEKQNLHAQLMKQRQSKVTRDELIKSLEKQLKQTSQSHRQSMQQCQELQGELKQEKESYATKLTEAARRYAIDRKTFSQRECVKRMQLAEKRASDAEKDVEVLKHLETPIESHGSGDERPGGVTEMQPAESSADVPSSNARSAPGSSSLAPGAFATNATKEEDEKLRECEELQQYALRLEITMQECPNCRLQLDKFKEESVLMEDVDLSPHLQADANATQMQLDHAVA